MGAAHRLPPILHDRFQIGKKRKRRDYIEKHTEEKDKVKEACSTLKDSRLRRETLFTYNDMLTP